jgi:hypothetical protein
LLKGIRSSRMSFETKTSEVAYLSHPLKFGGQPERLAPWMMFNDGRTGKQKYASLQCRSS